MTIDTSARTENLARFVRNHAETTPDATALIYEDQRWTWAQWDGRIREMTAALRAAGIGRGDVIGFLDKNNPACLETVYAAAAIGAAVTIANWRQVGDELMHVFTDSAPRLLIVGDEFADTVEDIADRLPAVERVVVVGGHNDQYEDFLASAHPLHTSDAIGDDVSPEDPLLVMYSSGTTGRPKGVVLSQRALLAHTVNVAHYFPFEKGDMSLVAMPLFHVGGISYSMFGVRAGAPTIMTREPTAPALVGALMAGATHTFFVPPVVAGFLAAGGAAIAAMAKLKVLGYGAAPMPLPLLRKALDAWPDIAFVQVYGQTEISGVATVLAPEDHRDPAREHRLLSVGRPVGGVAVEVRDVADGTLVAAGEQGEVCLRTEQAMSEYLHRPEDTAQTLVDGWIRTGDIGRMDADGYVYVDDRLKDMIITGGENVYGPEVERVLLDHPDVSDAAIIGVPDERWGESVLAVVVLARPTETDGIIAFCRERLAAYKCPRSVEVVEELPRNASGKILKRELRGPHWEGLDRQV